MKPEQKLQRQCFDAFKKMWPHKIFIHIPNERKSKMEVIWLKAQGTLTGCPDILIPETMKCKYENYGFRDGGQHLVGYWGLWIELKCKPNKPSESQLTVMKMLADRGHAVAVCYSLDEFINTVSKYFEGQWNNQP